jgi:asparagine synthase (glutamine-hydrolysing)
VCGIAGCFFGGSSFEGDDEARLARMTDALTHRGPDAVGTLAGVGFALGHRRLAIRGLGEQGRQPMRHPSGQVLAYNGEIYNADALRDELSARGERFVGTSDTEVLLAALASWGVHDALARLNGMFAFALADPAEGKLVLARDRMGIKPLHWARDDAGRVWFCSEIEPLARHAPIDRALDRDALATYARLGFVPGPATVFRSIRQLPPGHVLALGSAGDARPERWWSAAFAPRLASHAEAVEELGRRLDAAVRRRLVADVPLGAFLSGGIDSSAICALVRRAGLPLATFSIGYEDEPAIDESRWADLVAKHLGTEHTLFRVGASDVEEAILAVVGRQGQPFADPSLVPTYLVSRLARRHVTVALSGDGADELFAGYAKYLAEAARAKANALPAVARRALAAAGRRLPATRFHATGERLRKTKKLLTALDRDGAERWTALQSLMPDASRAASLFAEPLRAVVDAPEGVRAALGAHGDTLTAMLAADQAVTLPDRMLFKVDAASMASSLEVRVPFLDHEVVELARSMRESSWLRGRQRKRVLRELARPWLPAELDRRPKQGFDMPIGRYLSGPLTEPFLDHVRSEAAADLLEPDAVEALLRDQREGREAGDFALWAVFVLAVWADRLKQSPV